MTQGPFSERGKRPLLFMPFFGKQARKDLLMKVK